MWKKAEVSEHVVEQNSTLRQQRGASAKKGM